MLGTTEEAAKNCLFRATQKMRACWGTLYELRFGFETDTALFYGEVTPEEEDEVDQHLHECVACSAQMEQQRAIAGLLDQRRAAIRRCCSRNAART
ncbi:MAG: zf-HC2 domain-containing protein [Ignavibacteriota bacterium]